MTTELGVSWEEVEKAARTFKDFYCNWRGKVEKGDEVGILVGVYRKVVFEVMEEAKGRRVFSRAEFPYEGPKLGELPGLFKVKETVETEKLRENHTAIYREAVVLDVYGYWSEPGAIAKDLALLEGKRDCQMWARVLIKPRRMRKRRNDTRKSK